MELDDGVHGDEDGHVIMIKALTWKRRKIKTIKIHRDQGKGINRILFWHSRYHRGCE
jgi:hypothetical protein